MKLATWNVNSLRVRLPHLLDWLAAHSPDAMCLQETKCEDAQFPAMELRAAGYCSLHCGQRTYNGVAILTRTDGVEVCRAIPDFVDDQCRVLAADYEGVRLVSVRTLRELLPCFPTWLVCRYSPGPRTVSRSCLRLSALIG